MFIMHVLINRTSCNVTLDDRAHILIFALFGWGDIPPWPPSAFTVITCSRSSKSYVFLTIDLSLEHWVSSDKAQGLIYIYIYIWSMRPYIIFEQWERKGREKERAVGAESLKPHSYFNFGQSLFAVSFFFFLGGASVFLETFGSWM